MSTEKSMFSGTGPRLGSGMLRLTHDSGALLPKRNTGGEWEPLAANDPRWIFAVLVRIELDRGSLSNETRDRLFVAGERLGLGILQVNALIAIAQCAHERGGFDSISREEILSVPESSRSGAGELSDRSRWLVFGVLFCWALMIAGLMQMVA